MDTYTGWRPVPGDTVDRIGSQSVTPLQFFKRYVVQRRPVVLTGGLPGVQTRWSAWTDEYLLANAGNADVRVEARASAVAAFGAHAHQRMLFSEFLGRLRDGNELLYLTTEATQFDAHGRLSVVSPPLTHLLGDVPLRPPVMGALLPAALNLWMGRSTHGASSGLHHDWHDNLYALLRGRKRFELYAPSETGKLYPHGKVEHVHPNGRIVYAGGMACRPDGADARDVARVASLDVQLAEAELESAEASGQQKRIRRAEAVLDAAMEIQLDDANGEDAIGDDDAHEEPYSDDDEQGSPPPHFSRVDRSKLHDFPLFTTARCTAVELGPGDLLYLPCGWWHNVTSWSDAARKDSSHLAVNWWFHPPDAARFDRPYTDNLWQRDFDHWMRDVLPTYPGSMLGQQEMGNKTRKRHR